jgi:hypothetical protein
MASTGAQLAPQFIFPVGNEQPWTNLLAGLITAAPQVAVNYFGLDVEPDQIEVAREFTLEKLSRIDPDALTDGEKQTEPNSRPDLVIRLKDDEAGPAAGRLLAVIESKMLASIGSGQLDRYARILKTGRHGDDVRAFLLYPPNLRPYGEIDKKFWAERTWDQVLKAFLDDADPWLADLTRQAIGLLDSWAEEGFGASSVWRTADLGLRRPGDAAKISLRRRIDHVAKTVGFQRGRVEDVNGKPHIIGDYYDEAHAHGYFVRVEMTDHNSAQAIGSTGILKGPVAAILLAQHVPDKDGTSEGFDWDYLGDLFLEVVQHHEGIVFTPAPSTPRTEHDVENRSKQIERLEEDKRLELDGVPSCFGSGYGNAQISRGRWCGFGFRVAMPPKECGAPHTVAEVVEFAQGLDGLLRKMKSADLGREPGPPGP